MARTPVARTPVPARRDDDRDRRGGIPLWVWPLIPLLLGLLSLGLAMRGNDEQSAADTNRQSAVAGANSEGAANGNAGAAGTNGQGATNGNQGAAGTNAGAAVTDMLAVVNDGNPASFAGRPATFANVVVQSVPGDRGFWIGPDANQQLFVAFDEANAGRPEGQVQITPGQRLTLGGVIEAIPPAGQIPAEWGLTPESAAYKPVYLKAQQITAGQ